MTITITITQIYKHIHIHTRPYLYVYTGKNKKNSLKMMRNQKKYWQKYLNQKKNVNNNNDLML